MKKKMAMSLLTVVLAVGMLAGCGTSNKTGDNAAADQTAASDKSAGQDKAGQEKVKLVMTFWGGDKDKETYRKRLDLAKQKYPNIEVDLQQVTGDYNQKVQTMIAGGTAPDIMEQAEGMQAYAAKGQLEPLDDYIAKSGFDMSQNFDQGIADIFKYQGKQYAMPDRAGAMILYYNKDMFEKAGVDYPTKDWSWQDMLDAAQKLTIRDGDQVKQYGFMTIDWWPYWMAFMYQNGASIFDQNMKPTFNTPEMKEALQFYHDLAFKYKVSPTPADAINMGKVGPDNLFAQGKLAMELTGFWNIQSLMNVQGVNWDIAPMWHGKDKAIPAFFSGLTISKDSKHKKEAFEILTAMASQEGQMPIGTNGEDVPANKLAMSSPDFLNAAWLGGKKINMQTFADSGDSIFVPPLNPQWNEMMKAIDDKLSVYLNDKANVDDTIAQVQSGLEKIYK